MAQRYAWTGHTPQGSTSGVIDAVHASAAAQALIGRGIVPLTIRETGAAGAGGGGSDAGAVLRGLLPAHAFEAKVAPVDLLVFSRQLNTLLRAGVPILRALMGLQETATSDKMKTTLAEVRRSLESGIALSMSLAQHPRVFDNFYIALVRVGEMTGRLDEIFLRLFHHQEFELFMRQQIKSALRYPSFVVSAMVAAIGVINVMVIPAFATVFQQAGATLPLATRILLATSRFTLDYGGWLALGAMAGAVVLRAWIATPEGRLRWDGWMLRVPVAGKIVRKAMLARFARSFSLSLKSGVPISQALSVVAQTVDNQHIARRIEGMRESVERGESVLRAAAVTGIFTPVVLQMLAVGEETGAIDELLEEVSDLYNNEVQYELKTLSAQLEPILIIFLGVLVLILALGVFLPVWDLGRTAFAK
ncbi:type II secretion system F family protein [Sphaerotilus sp.]|uniref:type II secretion system F family protein n=1 Tax=Sphaerotilus sp. TaxID=2093942 RepID=UPI0025ECC5BC|nr:type II secretion system F family protein [Sphaerotilus sp.]